MKEHYGFELIVIDENWTQEIVSGGAWVDINSVLSDINRGRVLFQCLGFVDMEPTLIVPDQVYNYLITPGFYPQDNGFTHLDFLLNNAIVESIISIPESTENVVYLGVNRYDYSLFPEVKYFFASIIITEVNLEPSDSSTQTVTKEDE